MNNVIAMTLSRQNNGGRYGSFGRAERYHSKTRNKIVRGMKLTVFIILIASLQVSAHCYAQITFSGKDVPLEKVFSAIEKQTAYRFFYNDQVLAATKPVTIVVSNAAVTDVLDVCLEHQQLTYSIKDRIIFIKKVETKVIHASSVEVLPEVKEWLTVKGVVTDVNGTRLPGVSVQVKGTKNGTNTNLKGEFRLEKIAPDATLVFTSVGYNMVEVPVNNQTALVIKMEVAVGNLDELQVVAYGATSRRFSTGNVSTVKAADIEKQPVQNPLLALQGRVPGLVVTQNSGVPGGGVTVRVQGRNSIANGNDPLFVIDGVPVSSQLPPSVMGMVLGESGTSGSKGNPLSFLDMGGIESIEVLKDADATAIYGSRAANGAILITTKKGKAGRTAFDMHLQAGFGKMSQKIEMMNTRQYLDMRYEAIRNDGLIIDPNRDYDLTLWDTTRYTDWQKELLGNTAKYYNVNTTLQGGTGIIQYRINGNYHKETSVFLGNFVDERVSVNFALNNRSVNGKLYLAFSGTYLHDKNKLPSLDLTQIAIGLAPNAPPLYNPDGTINWAPTVNGISTFLANPIIRQYQSYENSTDNLISSLTVSYALSNDVSLKASMGYNVMRSSEFIGNPLLVVPPESRSFPQRRRAQYGDRRIIGWNFEPQIFYKKKIENHQVDLLAGVTFYSNTIDAASVIGYDHLSDALLRNKAAAAILQSFEPTSMAEYRYHALFGRFSYNYMNKYIINVNLRRDGSSRFGTANRFENFGSIGGAWVFTEEEFFRNVLKVIGFGKLKISYGITGSDQIADYRYLSLYTLQNVAGLNLYQGVRGLQPASLPNPQLQWEKTNKFNAGVDMGFFDNRMLLNFNFGINRSSNQLLSYVLASTAGFQHILSNFPALIENTSYEITLNATNMKRKGFQWTSNVNLTIPNNKLVSFPGLATSSYANQISIGQPINARNVYRFAGVNPATGMYQFYTKNGHITIEPTTEDVIYVNANPRFYGGIENAVSFMDFQLVFHFQFIKQLGQNVLLNNGMGAIPGRFSVNAANSNQPITVLGRWQKPNDQSAIEKFGTSSSSSFYNATISTAALTDASFVRFKNIALSYLLPSSVRKIMGVSYGSIFIHAQNLFTITRYEGLDPENQGSMTLPPLRVVIFGVQLGF